MKKLKKLLACALSTILIGGCFTAYAEPAEPSVEWYIPKTIKVGDFANISTNPNKEEVNQYIGYATNVSADNLFIEFDNSNTFFPAHMGGISKVENGNAKLWYLMDSFYAPGTTTIQLYANFDTPTPVGDSYTFTVEEPVVQTNAPKAAFVGDTINFQSKLANTSLTDKKVAPYIDPKNYAGFFYEELLAGVAFKDDTSSTSHQVAYLPKVEVIEGQDLVQQTDQDYSNILSSSENLTFTGSGTVKLKITYQQIMTCSCMGEWEDNVADNAHKLLKDYRYSPTATVTIQVSEPPVSVQDDQSGIQLDAESGVLPTDASLKVSPLAQDTANSIANMLKEKADKVLGYDISILSNNQSIQPNGFVTVTMPIPENFDIQHLALYHFSSDNKLTDVDFTLSEDNKFVIFKTDHFSPYILAQLKEEPSSPEQNDNLTGNANNTNNTQPTSPQTGDSMPICFIALIGTAGAGIAFIVKKKKCK